MSDIRGVLNFVEVMGITDAQVFLFCPGCGDCHAPNIKAYRPGAPVWTWNGDCERPTFSPSLLVTFTGKPGPDDKHPFVAPDATGRVCHSFVTDGNWQFLDDCTHWLRGQTVAVPAFRYFDEDDEDPAEFKSASPWAARLPGYSLTHGPLALPGGR